MKNIKTKDLIIETCKNIIFSQGLKASTAGNIAELGGFSKSSIFYYFKNIDELHELVLESSIDNLNPILKDNYEDFIGISDYIYTSIEKLLKNQGKARDLKILFTFAHDKYFFTSGNNIIKDLLIKDISQDIVKAIKYYFPNYRRVESQYIGSLIMTSFNGLGVFLLEDSANERFLRNWKIQADMVEAYLLASKDK